MKFPAQHAVSPAAWRARRALVGLAETDAVVRLDAERTLRAHGFRVLRACTEQPYFPEPPDVIVVGSWPGSQQACAQALFGLRAGTPLLMTACEQHPRRHDAATLLKPYTGSELLRCVRLLLHR